MSIHAIQRIFSQYCQYLDDGRYDEVAQMFAEDGKLVMEAFAVNETGPKAIRAKYDQITDPKLKGSHAAFNHIIDLEGNNAAKGVADFLMMDLAQAPRILVVGRYTSRFVLVGADWKIKEWKIEMRANAFGT